MVANTTLYKTDLKKRYWQYRPEWGRYFDRLESEGIRPPVFYRGESWRNVIVNPNGGQQEFDRLLSMVPDPERHKWFGSMNSSQALAQSVFGNMAIYDFLGSLTDILDDDGIALFGKSQLSSDNFVMERKIDHLNEPRRTSLDGYINGDYQVAIECKFTEPEIGTCSRPRLKPENSEYCDGTYALQRARKNRCSLAELGILYWQYIPQLFRWDSEHDLNPCPLNKTYQLVRNILAVGVKDGNASPANGHAVLIYDERNPAFQEERKGFIAFTETQKALFEPTMLRKCSWQRIVMHLRNKGILPWLTERLALKYGL